MIAPPPPPPPPPPSHSTSETVARVELVCLEHLDIGFTATPQEIARRQKEHLDHAILLCEERPDFRWTIESIWQIEEWLKRTPDPSERARLVALVREGRIEITAGFANLHTGVMDAELILRSFEPADAIRRELGVEITSCVQDDVPGFSSLLPAAMKEAGIRYFLAGVNTTFGGGTSLGMANNPFWWEGLDGSGVLAWVAHGSYVEAERIGLGVWSKDEESEAQLAAGLQELAKSGYAFDRVLVMASTGDNGDPFAARSILRKVDAWNAKHELPRISFTTPAAFLSSLEDFNVEARGRAGSRFPIVRGDWSGHWEPVKSTTPAGTALFREAQALWPGAEALALRASLELGDSFPYPQHDLDMAFRQLLVCAEHSRPNGVGWPKLMTKSEVEAAQFFDYEQAHLAAETLRGVVARVTDAYAERLAADGPALVVANPSAVEQKRGAIVVPPYSLRKLPIQDARTEDRQAGADAGTGSPELKWLLPPDAGEQVVEPPLGIAHVRELLRESGRDGERWEWRASLDLGARELEGERPDPLRFLLSFDEVLGSALGAPSATTSGIAWTSAAGVLRDEDFLPRSLPLTRCTSGALRFELPPARGAPATAHREGILLTREAFGFQLGTPRWLGAGDPRRAPPLWLHALDLPLEGETKDQGPVKFSRIEPAPDDRRDFHFTWIVRDVDAEAALWQRDAALVREALAWRCPLFERPYKPWFPSASRDPGVAPLFVANAENVLVLSCRPARSTSGARTKDLLVRVQEIGGAPSTSVELKFGLEGFPDPIHLELGPHEVRTLRFTSRD